MRIAPKPIKPKHHAKEQRRKKFKVLGSRFNLLPFQKIRIMMFVPVSSLLFLFSTTISYCSAQLVESERLREYEKRNHTWPPQQFVPDTPGWKELMMERLAQIAQMEKSQDRYEGYLQTIHSAVLAPNFTELGFGLARASDGLMEALRKGIRDGVATAREEGTIEVIGGPHRPWFIDRPDLTERVLNELQAYPEAWSGKELIPFRAYGFRLYRNQSSLYMHVDKPETHIVSLILHIDSSDDAEPWPIFIEDFQGNTHEVILTSGDILFYESSKCFHGRPRPFSGTWYSSIFVHYYPVGWREMDHKMETHFAVPPIWSKNPTTPRHHYKLEMAGTSMLHPECPDDWCLTQNSVKWSGPGEPGYWIAPDFTKHLLDLNTAPSMQRSSASRLQQKGDEL